MPFHPIEDIIEDIKQGKPVVMVDDEDRENEGDVIFAAEKATPELVNFMAKHARGLICLPLTAEKCQQLKLPLMVPSGNGAKFGTNFTLSIEAAEGVTTGISVHDRAKTILAAVHPQAKAEDIVQPGHIFPIIAQPGGVLTRAGHTEASTDLARLAGLEPAGVLCEIMNEDGSMMRGEALNEFCRVHQLKMGTIADLITYRMKHEATVECVHSRDVQTALGAFNLKVFKDQLTGLCHYCFVKGEAHRDKVATIRVHMQDPILDLPHLSHLRSDSVPIESALKLIAQSDNGAFVLLTQPSNDNIAHRIEQLTRQLAPSSDAVDDSSRADWRLIGVGSQILFAVGYGKIRVLGSKKRYYGLSGFGLTVVDFETAK